MTMSREGGPLCELKLRWILSVVNGCNTSPRKSSQKHSSKLSTIIWNHSLTLYFVICTLRVDQRKAINSWKIESLTTSASIDPFGYEQRLKGPPWATNLRYERGKLIITILYKYISLSHNIINTASVFKVKTMYMEGVVAQLDREPLLTCVWANMSMSFFSLGKRSSRPASLAVSSSRSAWFSSRPSAPRHSCSRAIQSSAICERMLSSSARLL